MEPLLIEATKDTPQVHFDPDNQILMITERSLPENAIEFFEPVLAWLDNYIKNPNDETVFDFKLEYFNTASSKQIIKIILILEKLAVTKNTRIRWHYRQIDEDMESLGQRYARLIKVPFELVEY